MMIVVDAVVQAVEVKKAVARAADKEKKKPVVAPAAVVAVVPVVVAAVVQAVVAAVAPAAVVAVAPAAAVVAVVLVAAIASQFIDVGEITTNSPSSFSRNYTASLIVRYWPRPSCERQACRAPAQIQSSLLLQYEHR
jgi:hypothetical protein